ncbi:hypothetical protein IMSAGC009_01380 [Lachnospiraceae bacterium]|nr:hypothetical protein IMSAGC009_01380 [Lachnospiraceae bacterium]
MKKVILFSPKGYVGRFTKERIQSEKNMQLYEITRDSNLKEYNEDYDIMIYSAATRYALADKYVQDNVVSVIRIVDFCKTHHVQRIIYLSSDEIYGELNTDEVNENAVMINPGLYGISKYLAERIIIESGIPYYIMRMPGIVGRTWGKTFLYRLMDNIKNNKDIELYNANKSFNNVLDIDDLTRFLVKLCICEKKGENEIFLLGNTEKIKLMDVATYIKELYHSKTRIRDIDAKQKRYFTLDVTKASEYGYSSKRIKSIIDDLYSIQMGEN